MTQTAQYVNVLLNHKWTPKKNPAQHHTYRRWTEEEIAWLIDAVHNGVMRRDQVAHLKRRTDAIHKKIQELRKRGLIKEVDYCPHPRCSPWTTVEINMLIKLHDAHRSRNYMMQKLPGRSTDSIGNQLRVLRKQGVIEHRTQGGNRRG